MNFNNFTIKSQEVIQKAQEIALGMKHQSIENAHLLRAILTVDDNVTPFLFKKLNVGLDIFGKALEKVVESFARVEGGNQFLSQKANASIIKAAEFAKKMGDEFVSIEHLLLGILSSSDDTSQMLKDNGVTEGDLTKAIGELRKGQEKVKRTGRKNSQPE